MQQRSISKVTGNNSNQLIDSILASEEKRSGVTHLSRTLQDGTKAFLKNSRLSLLILLLSQQVSADMGRNETMDISDSKDEFKKELSNIFAYVLAGVVLVGLAALFYHHHRKQKDKEIRNAIEGDDYYDYGDLEERQERQEGHEEQERQGEKLQQEDLEMQRAEGKPKVVGKGIQQGEDDHLTPRP